jgi:hypothetical protein
MHFRDGLDTCCPGIQTIQRIYGGNLDAAVLHGIAIDLIEKAFHLKTKRAQFASVGQIIDPITKEVLQTQSISEVIELDSDFFGHLVGIAEVDIAGYYDIQNGTIFLDNKKWCMDTLMHETLHSRSAFSKKPCYPNFDFVIEGITELLVGLVFKRTLLDCYLVWQTIDNCFHNSYDEFVQPWHYLTYKINFDQIIELYFNQRINDPIQELGRILGKSCDKAFEKLFSNYSPTEATFREKFIDLMGKLYGSEFAEFMSTNLKETITLESL